MTAAVAHDPWEELSWLLGVLEDWLLIAEPDTVRGLGNFLRSVGSAATAGDVIALLGRLRSMLGDTASDTKRCAFDG